MVSPIISYPVATAVSLTNAILSLIIRRVTDGRKSWIDSSTFLWHAKALQTDGQYGTAKKFQMKKLCFCNHLKSTRYHNHFAKETAVHSVCSSHFLYSYSPFEAA